MYTKTKQDNGLAGSPFSIPARRVCEHLGHRSEFQPGAPALGPIDAANSGARQRAIIQNSPFNPFAGRNGTTAAGSLQTLRYRTVTELGLRRSFFDHDYFRYVGGLNGDFNFKDNGFISHFGYDTGFVYERYDEKRTDSGDATRGGIYREIIAGNFNPFIGQNAPTIGVAPVYDAAGVQIGTRPYDNVAASQRASYLGQSFFYERDWLADAKINAHLFPNMYNGGIDFALGYEHREVHSHQVPDPTQAQAISLASMPRRIRSLRPRLTRSSPN